MYFTDKLIGDQERLKYIEKNSLIPGPERTVDWSNLYEDVIDMYREGDIVSEYTLFIK